MGIPRFYRFITEQFPNVSQHTSFNEGFNSEQPIDNLYLDANGIIHNCAREVYFEDKVKPRLSWGGKKPPPPPSAQEQELKLFRAIAEYMDQLLKFVKPRHLFYIAIDGVAPLAKQSQQRQRRYKSAAEKTEEEFNTFDSTAITPGTTFMYRLGRYLRYYIRKMMSTDIAWQKVQVIFSGCEVPGEGEHKIVQYIREQPHKNKFTHCMYGLDADLFMLSLSTHCPRFYLLREDQFNTRWDDTLFYKVDIGALRGELFNMWGSVGGNPENLIDDFIFICFMVGNDFLHSLPCCHDLQESIIFTMDLRKQTLGSNYLTRGSSYNLNNLAILFTHLATTEIQAISAQYYAQNFPNITVNSSLLDPQYPNKGIDIKKYRKLYYRKAGIDHSDKHQVWSFCKQYLQGLEWVQYYYHNRPRNWQWYFPFHYSPLVTDIVDYLTNASSGSKLTRVSNKYLEPITPFQQLLCVVPPRSKKLLPGYLQYLYRGNLAQYYPEKFEIDLEGKMREWEGIALLPFIDLSKVIIASKDAEKRAAGQDQRVKYVRNEQGKTIQFWWDPRAQKYDYNSDYGKIMGCMIAYKNLD